VQIFLTTADCPDGNYEYFVRLFSDGRGNPKNPPVKFTVVCNQFGKKIDEGTATVAGKDNSASGGERTDADTHCLTLTVKNKKVTKSKFHIKTKSIPID
jgi:hypothetical protein